MATKIYLIMDEETMNDEYIKTCISACRLLTDERNIFFERIIFSSFDQIHNEDDGMNYLFIIPNNIEIVPAIIFAPIIRKKFNRALISFIIPFNEKEYVQKLARFDVDTVFIKPTSISLMKQSISILINSFIDQKIVTNIKTIQEVKKEKDSVIEPIQSELADRLLPEYLTHDINTLFMRMYFGKHFKGYRYSMAAVMEAINVMKSGHNIYITKNIYPVIAKQFDTSTQNIEHNIRTYVERVFDEPNEFVIRNFMIPFSIDERPSNGEFISIIADGFLSGWVYKYINKNRFDKAI